MPGSQINIFCESLVNQKPDVNKWQYTGENKDRSVGNLGSEWINARRQVHTGVQKDEKPQGRHEQWVKNK